MITTPYLNAIADTELVRRTGSVTQFLGLVVEADGPEVFWGERCEIRAHRQSASTPAQVVGIKDGRVLLMPYGELRGISLGSDVIATGRGVEVPVGEALLGRVVNAFGEPLDAAGPLSPGPCYPIHRRPLNPLQRPSIDTVLETGIRAVDTLMTVGRGQRLGIFAGSGVGKSTLLGMISRNMNADVNVIALIGERGREVMDFIKDVLGTEGLARSVIVVATSDQPALVRAHAALAATAIAEYFRDQGRDVVLTMDSITRFAMAQREIGLAVGEPPTSRGYTPSVFAMLPRLLERCGTAASGGSITAFYTVLVEGDDLNDPIADHVRAILDGGIVLSRALANRKHYPSIDILHSNSRLMSSLVDADALALSAQLTKMVDTYERARDMVDIGAYRSGANPELDTVISAMPAIDRFLAQPFDEKVSRQSALQQLRQLPLAVSPA
ncbi:FliI/YscN family ATPase [Exilibacterium tricleocarpae]|uniref:protein-secreting ATPase n=1 Tax=Exilibacterium tricleocarpae TaxID=2591008 RepID=A0A545T863_9GAMM|nr:FliI/YscN family ATPase [Exilibacterium tricleocarpae]TQV73413.1 FliI/YscN family ATPase [Exilibacterium tricleocarpae]